MPLPNVLRTSVAAALVLAPIAARAEKVIPAFTDQYSFFQGTFYNSRFEGCSVSGFCLVGLLQQGTARATGLPTYRVSYYDQSGARSHLPGAYIDYVGITGAELTSANNRILGNLVGDAARGMFGPPIVGTFEFATTPADELDDADVANRDFFAAHGYVPLASTQFLSILGIYAQGDESFDGEELIVADVSGITAAPEPATWALLGTGLVALGAVARRRA